MSDSKTSPDKQVPSEIIARFLWQAVNEPRQGYFALAEGMVAVLAGAGYAIVPVGGPMVVTGLSVSVGKGR